MPQSKSVLLAEGKVDMLFIGFLQNKLNLRPENHSLPNKKNSEAGFKALMKRIDTYAKEAEVLLIVFDADLPEDNRYQSIKRKLSEIGITAPDTLEPDGTILDKDDSPECFDSSKTTIRRLALWQMPDNRSDGMLEDFFLKLLQTDDLMSHAQQVVTELISHELHRFNEGRHKAKAVFKTWMAWQKDPDDKYVAYFKKYFDLETKLSVKFIEWYKQALREYIPETADL